MLGHDRVLSSGTYLDWTCPGFVEG